MEPSLLMLPPLSPSAFGFSGDAEVAFLKYTSSFEPLILKLEFIKIYFP